MRYTGHYRTEDTPEMLECARQSIRWSKRYHKIGAVYRELKREHEDGEADHSVMLARLMRMYDCFWKPRLDALSRASSEAYKKAYREQRQRFDEQMEAAAKRRQAA